MTRYYVIESVDEYRDYVKKLEVLGKAKKKAYEAYLYCGDERTSKDLHERWYDIVMEEIAVMIAIDNYKTQDCGWLSSD